MSVRKPSSYLLLPQGSSALIIAMVSVLIQHWQTVASRLNLSYHIFIKLFKAIFVKIVFLKRSCSGTEAVILFPTMTDVFDSCNRDLEPHKNKNIHFLVLYRKFADP